MIADFKRLCPEGISLGYRRVEPGDARFLLAEEQRSIVTKSLPRRDQSGAARFVARQLLADRGMAEMAIGRAPSGAPVWPQTIVGSLAHDDMVAVAAIGSAADYQALGVDVEPAMGLPEEIRALVRHKADRTPESAESALMDRLLFCAKEAVYKAVFPLDRVMLNYEDICVDFVKGRAETKTGRGVELVYALNSRLWVLSYLKQRKPL
ncbi:4'-phosphopantetheinyl transferase Npt [Brucella sp. NBRC 12953]|uniref:4'-phosphopantetheinyl transferase family protein n=1 Tax=Brucella sp. NBRC 12953 TaxID=3075481 RepID=UPI0030A335A0